MLMLQTPFVPRLYCSYLQHSRQVKSLPFFVLSKKSEPKPEDSKLNSTPGAKPRSRNRRLKVEPVSQKPEASKEEKKKKVEEDGEFPTTRPRKPRRGRRSEAVAVEDFIRGSLERTFASIREQSSEVLENKENVMKERPADDEDEDDEDESDTSDDDDDGVDEDDVAVAVADEKNKNKKKKKKMVVEEESQDWPLDADIGWGIRASEYFDKHPIKNVVGEDGVEIDWEGEIDDNWVKEINCLEWESFAFHPSPLVVLVFERYKRATDNWKALKELEKALKVYRDAKDRLPPRSVKIDINIERDLAYALKVKEGPQILFLRGNRILYRETEIRKADELVQMIAHFYYNAKRPSWIDVSGLSPRYPY
ncbi:Thioredoxin-like fold containing protein [Trema orientale]|uniref:Thioredoxin-like fold containing protein n=1 Tax=Trema orientale TaxID=63057 RepID=A0A2P5ACC3_TREOI|nr:Thioredoxin-like fold containing protein [Trema orientale]